MAVYPNNIYTTDSVSPNTPRVGHASLHDSEQNEVVAIETYAGVENSTVNNTLDYMIRHGWINDPNTPTYGSTTEFSVTGNRTNFYTVGRKVRFNDSIYATTVSSTYVSASNLTNVIVDNAVVPNPINSLDYGVYSDGATQINGEYAIESGTITSAQIASDAGITGSQLSSTAGITGSQLSSTAGITGSQIVSGVALSGTPSVSGGLAVSGTPTGNYNFPPQFVTIASSDQATISANATGNILLSGSFTPLVGTHTYIFYAHISFNTQDTSIYCGYQNMVISAFGINYDLPGYAGIDGSVPANYVGIAQGTYTTSSPTAGTVSFQGNALASTGNAYLNNGELYCLIF